MDRPRVVAVLRRAQIILAALLLGTPGCGGSHSTRGEPLAPGETVSMAAVDLGMRKVVARNALAYHVAVSPGHLITVELNTKFELVVRPRNTQKNAGGTRRIYLDAPTYDILDLVVSRAGDAAYVASAAGWVRRYSLRDGTLETEWRTGSAATALAISDDDRYLFIGSDRGTVCLRRLRDGAQLQCMIAHRGRLGDLVVQGDHLATASHQGELALWSIPSLARRSYAEGSGSIAALAFAPDGETLAVARNKLPPRRSQAIADQELRTPNIHESGANQIELYRVEGGRLSAVIAKRLVGHRSIISALAMSAAGLVSVSWDRSVRLWNIETATETRKLLGFQHILQGVALSPDTGDVVVVGWAINEEGPAVTRFTLSFPTRHPR